MSAGVIPRTRAAASSIASGTWSSRSQISTTAASFSAVSAKSARAIRARSTNSSTLSRDDAARARQRGDRPRVLAADAERRLTRREHRAPSSTNPPCGRRPRRPRSSRCSQLSITHERLARARPRAQRVDRGLALAFGHARAPRGSSPRPARPLRARRATRTTRRRGTAGATSAATCNARRDLPTPPGPVSVTSRSVSTSAGELLHLVGAADEARALHRQVARELVERAQRRELLGAELPDEHRAARGRGRRCSPRLRSVRPGTSSAVTADSSTCPP